MNDHLHLTRKLSVLYAYLRAFQGGAVTVSEPPKVAKPQHV